MRIGVNARFLLPNKMEGFGWYSHEVLSRMVKAHPEHEFIFFFDRPFDPKFVYAENVTPVVLFPPARHPFLFIWWFNWSITRALKKYRCDVFFSPDGYLSLRSNIPQIPVIHDLNFEHHPSDIPKLARWYLRKYFPKFAKKAQHIITVSEYSKADIVSTYHISEANISVAWNGASSDYQPISESKKSAVLAKFTNGKPYFIFVGSLHPRKNLKTLIDAFVLFSSKYQEMDLVIVGSAMWTETHQAFPALEKVKERVHFTGHLAFEQLTDCMASAHALVYIPYFEGFGIPIAEAMKCGIPVLAGNKTSLPEVIGDAGILVDPFDVQQIADYMEQLVQDQQLHQELSEKSLNRSSLFSWDTTALKVWEVIEKQIKK